MRGGVPVSGARRSPWCEAESLVRGRVPGARRSPCLEQISYIICERTEPALIAPAPFFYLLSGVFPPPDTELVCFPPLFSVSRQRKLPTGHNTPSSRQQCVGVEDEQHQRAGHQQRGMLPGIIQRDPKLLFHLPDAVSHRVAVRVQNLAGVLQRMMTA